MDWTLGIAAPAGLWLAAYLLGRHELRAYRDRFELGSDLFAYSRGRLWRRMSGVVVLALTGATLAAMEWAGPRTPLATSVYLATLATEAAALVILSIVDMVETTRTADSSDLTRQADPDRRTRSRPRPLPSASTPRSRRKRRGGR